jgi:hypothetical protein
MNNGPQPVQDTQRIVRAFERQRASTSRSSSSAGTCDRIRNAAVSGDGPDVPQAGTTQVPFFAALGGFQDLNPRIKASAARPRTRPASGRRRSSPAGTGATRSHGSPRRGPSTTARTSSRRRASTRPPRSGTGTPSSRRSRPSRTRSRRSTASRSPRSDRRAMQPAPDRRRRRVADPSSITSRCGSVREKRPSGRSWRAGSSHATHVWSVFPPKRASRVIGEAGAARFAAATRGS